MKKQYWALGPALGAALIAVGLVQATPAMASTTVNDTIHVTGKKVLTGCVAQMDSTKYTFNTVIPPGKTNDTTPLNTGATAPQNAGVTLACETAATITSVTLSSGAANVSATGAGWKVESATDPNKFVLVRAYSKPWTATADSGMNGVAAVAGDSYLYSPNLLDASLSMPAASSYHNAVAIAVQITAANSSPGLDYTIPLVYTITY
jgi:hypothetical protein